MDDLFSVEYTYVGIIMSSSTSSSKSGSIPSALLFLPCIALPTDTHGDVQSVTEALGVELPSALVELLTKYGGFQVTPNTIFGQNVHTNKLKQFQLGPFFHAVTDAKDGSEDFHLLSINQPFLETSPSGTLPFFAFGETSCGCLVIYDCNTQSIMFFDSHAQDNHTKYGPFIAAESIEDFLQRLTAQPEKLEVPAGKKKGNSSGDHKEEEEEEEEVEYDPENVEVDGADDEEFEEEEYDVYCCDACLKEIPPTESRFHCDQCNNYDLCHRCKDKSESGTIPSSSTTSSTSSSTSSSSRTLPSGHLSTHTFTRLPPTRADESEGDDEDIEDNDE